MMYWK